MMEKQKMKTNDFLLKKWCFGMGRSKAREEAVEGNNGELHTYRTYPKYRTIVFKVGNARKEGEMWHLEGTQYASLTAKPKKVKMVLRERNGLLYKEGQKRPFMRIQDPNLVQDNGLPPVGSLISVNKKHAIVTEVNRNQLTVFVNGELKTITCKPGSIKWFGDKILKNMA